MIFRELTLKDAFIVDIERRDDERGFFARTFCEREFEAHGLNRRLAQSSISFNKNKGTLRGMHYQTAPNEEAKVVRCTQGAIYDVIIDLRQVDDDVINCSLRAADDFCLFIWRSLIVHPAQCSL